MFLNTRPTNLVKTLVVVADDKPVAALIRGDHELNLIKLQRHLKAEAIDLAGPDVIVEATKAPVGFAGPVGLSIPMIADNTVKAMRDFVVGGNAEDAHLTGVNFDRDFTPTAFADIRNAEAGDGCPVCDGALQIHRGIEVGHIFKLGTKYSNAMGATFLDESGQDNPTIMGCYGIGIGRTAASAIEQNHDDFGILWPIPIAPFHVVLTTIAPKGEVIETADALYQEMLDAGIEVLYDDRDERPGVKFKDADLLGIPIRVTVGAKALKEGCVELKLRHEKEFEKIPKDEIIGKVQAIIQEALNAAT